MYNVEGVPTTYHPLSNETELIKCKDDDKLNKTEDENSNAISVNDYECLNKALNYSESDFVTDVKENNRSFCQ